MGQRPSIDAVVEVPPRGPRWRPPWRQPRSWPWPAAACSSPANTDHTVAVIDVRTGGPWASRWRPVDPFAMAAGAGHVWVAGMGDNTLTRIAY